MWENTDNEFGEAGSQVDFEPAPMEVRPGVELQQPTLAATTEVPRLKPKLGGTLPTAFAAVNPVKTLCGHSTKSGQQ